LQPHLPPAYLLENVAFQHHPHQQIAAADYERVCSIIRQPTTFDAAQAGSLAHRLRNYWTNLGQPGQLQQALSTMQRPASRSVQIALQPGRVAMPVHRQDQYPQHVCNQPGQPRAAWPTLMGRQASYAFRPGQPGSILDVSNPAAAVWGEPVAIEREIMLGYAPGSTAAEGLSDRELCSALWQCMDANALQAIMEVCNAWWFRE
jgi:hypothetical protein